MKVTQDMTWVSLSIDSLKPAAYNPRKKLKKGDKEYEKIKKSIVAGRFCSSAIHDM